LTRAAPRPSYNQLVRAYGPAGWDKAIDAGYDYALAHPGRLPGTARCRRVLALRARSNGRTHDRSLFKGWQR